MSKEITRDQGILAPGGSQPPGGGLHLPGATTLEYSAGQEIQKVEVFSDQRNAQEWFFQSGRNAFMTDKKASLQMMEAAMPLIKAGEANFGFVFNEKLKLATEASCFNKIRHFERTRVCGKGAAGEVEAFQDKRTGLSFVRKRFKNGSSMRKEEVQSLIQLDHPGVLQVYALLCTPGTVDLLLQDAGHPLRDCLRMFCEKGITSDSYWKVVQDLSKQAFEALAYAHQKEICHLDIKPENLLVYQASKNLVLVIGDFGSSVSLTQPMIMDMGLTPEYWAPELWQEMEILLKSLQISNSSEQQSHQFMPRASFDVYAMGMCVYFMTSQKHLMKELEEQQKKHRPLNPLPDPIRLCRTRGQLMRSNETFFFQHLLMKEHAHQVPEWAIKRPKVFLGIPSNILRVMYSTLDPNPETRCSADQAAATLSEVTKERPAGEVNLRTPITVEDTSTDCWDRDHEPPKQKQQSREGADPPTKQLELQGHLPAESQHYQESMICKSETRSVLSAGVLRFAESMSQYMKMWDQNTAGSLQHGAAAMPKHFPMRTTTYHMDEGDIEIGSDSLQMNNGFVAACRPPSVFADCQAKHDGVRFPRGPNMIVGNTEGEDCSTCAEGIKIEFDLKTCEERENQMFIEALPIQSSAGVEKKGMTHGWECKDAEAGFSRGQKSVVSKLMMMSGNLEALSMQCHTETDDQTFRKPASTMSGKGKRKAAEAISKNITNWAVKNNKSNGKSRAGTPVHKLSFVVASSSRPKPSTHTLPGLSSVSTKPMSSISNLQPGSPRATADVWDMHQPCNASVSYGSPHLGYGDATQPSGRVAVDQRGDTMSGGSQLQKKSRLDDALPVGDRALPMSRQPPPPHMENHPQLVEAFCLSPSVPQQPRVQLELHEQFLALNSEEQLQILFDFVDDRNRDGVNLRDPARQVDQAFLQQASSLDRQAHVTVMSKDISLVRNMVSKSHISDVDQGMAGFINIMAATDSQPNDLDEGGSQINIPDFGQLLSL